jgi:hypothetical protein
MSNAVVEYETAVARLREAAREMQTSGELGRLFKFVKGTYSVGDDEVPIGAEMIAHVDQFAHGWTKFVDGRVVDQRIGKAAEGFRAPVRDDLDDQDEGAWERDASGRPRDPWSKQFYLPLENAETGDVVVFVTGSHGGRSAISKLLNVYARNPSAGLPIIKLAVSSYRHRTYGKIEMPDFPIVARTGSTQPAMATGIEEPPPLLEPVGGSSRDLDDEIPW